MKQETAFSHNSFYNLFIKYPIFRPKDQGLPQGAYIKIYSKTDTPVIYECMKIFFINKMKKNKFCSKTT